MQKLIWLVALILFSLPMLALTVYDIQYTTNTNGNSPYMNQSVTVQGIVTGFGVPDDKYYISDAAGGPWSGIYVYDYSNNPQLGDLVQVTATVQEYYNLTELSSITAFAILSSGNAIPQPYLVTTGMLANPLTAEQFEGVLVKVEDVNITQMPTSSYDEFYVNDGSGQCQVDNGFYPTGHDWTGLSLGQNWMEIRGIVDYGFSYYAINPRNNQDMILTDDISNCAVRIQTVTSQINTLTTLNVYTSKINTNWNVNKYSLRISYNPSLVHFEGVDTTGSLTPVDIPVVDFSAASDTLYISWEEDAVISSTIDDLILLKLKFNPVTYGEADINLDAVVYNNTSLASLTDGKISVPVSKKIAYLNIGNPPEGKNIFNPWLNEKIVLNYGARAVSGSANAKAIIRIYDVQGRLVATPVNKNITTTTGVESYLWDGRDSSRILLPIGVYYCHLEVIDRITGNKEVAVQPIVVAAELK